MKNLIKSNNINDSAKIKSVAIVRTDRLGDMILTLPMAKSIKEFFPEISISIIAKSYNEALFINNPNVDAYFLVDKIEGGINSILSSNSFDTIFYPMPIFDEVFASFKNKIKYRIGTAFRLYSFLFNFKIHDHRKISEFHEAEYNVRMVNQFFGIDSKPKLIKPFINDSAKNFVSNDLNSMDKAKKNIILHPGSRGSARDWDINKFADLAVKLQNKFNIILTGTDSEKKACDFITSKATNCFNLAGKFQLDELMALIESSNLMVANSTGVLHLAAAIGIKTIGLYPNTAHIGPNRWRPYSDLSQTITPAFINEIDKDNMNLISVEQVENLIINSI